jgi:hypothetical protein
VEAPAIHGYAVESWLVRNRLIGVRQMPEFSWTCRIDAWSSGSLGTLVRQPRTSESPESSFAEAATAFADPLSITIPDPDHSADENRFILVGTTHCLLLVVVAHVERGGTIRIIGKDGGEIVASSNDCGITPPSRY